MGEWGGWPRACPSVAPKLYTPPTHIQHPQNTGVLIVSPTRELAVQTHLMLTRLAQFTDMTACLVVGGSRNLRAQEAELRARPDIVVREWVGGWLHRSCPMVINQSIDQPRQSPQVCTPGRMLDHLHNSHSVLLDDLEILVRDFFYLYLCR